MQNDGVLKKPRRPVSYCRLLTWRNFKAELAHVVRIALPLIGSFVSLLCTPIVGYIYLGHIDDGGLSLAAASLSHLFANMTGVSICVGLLSAFDTLAAQAFGAKNFQRVGILFQRSLALMGFMCIPVLSLWLAAEKLLLVVGQDPKVASMSGAYLRLLAFAFPPMVAFETIKRYLQTHAKTFPILLATGTVTLLCIPMNYFFIHMLGMGYLGAAATFVAAMWMLTGALTMWMIFSGFTKKTWPLEGWSREALQEWPAYLKLGLPGAGMMCAEWWGFEVHAFVAGIQGTTSLAAQSLLINIVSILFMIPLALGISVSTRVGRHLGANRAKAAALSSGVAVVLITAFELVLLPLLFLLRKSLAMVFTDDTDLISLLNYVIPMLLMFAMGDAQQGLASGVLRGCGKQLLCFGINVGAYWGVAIPLGVALAFKASSRVPYPGDNGGGVRATINGTSVIVETPGSTVPWTPVEISGMGIFGQWLGLSLAVCITSVIFMFLISRMKWHEEAHIVSEREKKLAAESQAAAAAVAAAKAAAEEAKAARKRARTLSNPTPAASASGATAAAAAAAAGAAGVEDAKTVEQEIAEEKRAEELQKELAEAEAREEKEKERWVEYKPRPGEKMRRGVATFVVLDVSSDDELDAHDDFDFGSDDDEENEGKEQQQLEMAVASHAGGAARSKKPQKANNSLASPTVMNEILREQEEANEVKAEFIEANHRRFVV